MIGSKVRVGSHYYLSMLVNVRRNDLSRLAAFSECGCKGLFNRFIIACWRLKIAKYKDWNNL